jgi:malate dehydrogenase (oxaloacetate-decarboxylating)(NADP+)
MAPALEVEGEMHADAALSPFIREEIFPNSRLKGAANLLIMPSLDAANISMELLRSINDALLVGPILSGTALPAHIATPSATARGIYNISALAIADVWRRKNAGGRTPASPPARA